MARVVGIDLGTTNSVVAYLDHAGRPTSVTNFGGRLLTPSAVYLEGNAATVGEEAVKVAAAHPERLAEYFKRHMGEEWFPATVDSRKWRPEVLSAVLLKRLHTDASRRLGAVEDAVITVPAYFDECRRRATRAAGLIAGWRVMDLLNEPTAAAIACAHQRSQDRTPPARERLLVYDLGGGTFDVAVLEVLSGREYRTLATDGEVRLGGRDWDERLCQHFAEQFRRQTGFDPLASPRSRFDLLRHAQAAKHALSQRDRTTVPCRVAGRGAALSIDRATFETLTADLLERSRVTTELVLGQAGLDWKEIDRVLLVGGSTRMPAVAAMFEAQTGRPPDRSLSVDEAVAHGAALYAHLREQPGGAHAVNVTAHGYGVSCRARDGRRVALSLVPKNSPLPHTGQYLFSVSPGGGGGGAVSVAVCEGDSDDPDLCARVGTITLRDLPPPPPGKRWFIGVLLTCLADGRVAVEAQLRDPDNRTAVVRTVNATLTPEQGMGPEEIEQARRMVQSLELT